MEQNYEEQLMEYLSANMHPETARNIGRIVATSQLLSAEAAMAIILETQLDHVRQDEQISGQYELFENRFNEAV